MTDDTFLFSRHVLREHLSLKTTFSYNCRHIRMDHVSCLSLNCFICWLNIVVFCNVYHYNLCFIATYVSRQQFFQAIDNKVLSMLLHYDASGVCMLSDRLFCKQRFESSQLPVQGKVTHLYQTQRPLVYKLS